MEIRELNLNKRRAECPEAQDVLQEIAKLERHLFPKHESLSASLESEAKKRNGAILYARVDNPKKDRRQQGQELPIEEQEPRQGNNRSSFSVAGYVIVSFTSSMVASITKLAVRECCRRQGYGEALLRAAIVKCRERPISRLTLHVDPMRDAAMNLYKKLGFELDTVVIDYYAPHRDAHRMFIDFGTP